MSKHRAKLSPGLSWYSFKAEWGNWLWDKAPILAFSAKFGAFIVLLYGMLALPLSERVLYSYLEANAWASNLVLHFLGQGTEVSEVTIRSPEFAIAIRRGCDAVEPTGLLCGAILAFPGTLGRKLIGMVIGTFLLQLLNLLRIVTLFLIGSHIPVIFSSMHLEIWPSVFILMTIICFVGWKKWILEK